MPRCVVRRTFASGPGDSETFLRSVERRVSEGQPERFGAAVSARLGKGIGAGGGDRWGARSEVGYPRSDGTTGRTCGGLGASEAGQNSGLGLIEN